ncbi:DUF4440 domain-containing protein [Stappia indica]|uniref:DUF4440 domain-containing protein n=1 Tax=Stappia indica TaxID=538381 RepID=A0A285RA63_9HYPH|nr:DUF4440 domain-containing protein [Stappia indica]SOB90764.1 hypothetical protein SAMN05421512_101495 [Stappia indica]
MTGTGDIAAAAAREIVARHEFFVDWFAGRLEDSAFAAALAAFDPDFHRIGPDGALQDHNGLTAMLAAARGRFAEGFAIAIEDVAVLRETGDDALMTYVERQEHAGRTTFRRAGALFSRNADAPLGVAWRFVQETWINDRTDEQPAAE